METVGKENPTENVGRTTRRARINIKCISKLNEPKDQENVNNTSSVQNNIETIKDEVAKPNTLDEKVHNPTINLNSSTPRRKKDPLANLHSNLSPKYIGFTTPPSQLNSSTEERTLSLRKRQINCSTSEATEETNKSKEVDITFTPNTESTVGFVRRTPRNREQITPDNTKRKKFVSPIDKLLIKNGAVMEFNNNLPIENHHEIKSKDKKTHGDVQNIRDNDENELGVKELDMCDEEMEVRNTISISFKIDEKRARGDSCDDNTAPNKTPSLTCANGDVSGGQELDISENVYMDSALSEHCGEQKNSDNCEKSEKCESVSNENFTDKEQHEAIDDCEEKSEACETVNMSNEIGIESCKGVEHETEGENFKDIEHELDENCDMDEAMSMANEEEDDEKMQDDDNVSVSTEIANQVDDYTENSEAEEAQCDIDLNTNKTTLINDDKSDNICSNNDKEERVNDLSKTDAYEKNEIRSTEESTTVNEAEVVSIENEVELVAKDLEAHSQIDEKETLESEFICKEENSADDTESTKSLSGDQTREILKIIENSKETVIKIEVESEEAENNDFVEAPPVKANSPSAVSMDSAKGSSINNEGSWVSFSTGDLFWGQIYNFCYWPCMVCPDPDGKTIITEEVSRTGDQTILVHVRFFADNGRRNWVKRENLMPFVGIESYQERIVDIREKYGSKSMKYKLYVPTKKKEQVWFEAVNEANIVAEIPYADRLEKFYEIFEQSKAFHKLKKQRRKSMYISVNSAANSDIESCGSNDNNNSQALTIAAKNKRERSISPYSPAYSPIKSIAAKRRRLSNEEEVATSSTRRALIAPNSEENLNNSEINLSQTNSVASASSNTNSLSDLDLYNALEFRKLYAYMKDYVMEQNHDDKLERSLVVAVRNIWALKQLNRRQMERKLRESLSETDLKPTLELTNSRTLGEGSVKRLSSRLKTLMARKSLLPQQLHDATPERSLTPKNLVKEASVEKVKTPINRPILEVIDDIFDLDTKYLFRGMSREPVCKYCLKPGNLRKCAKNCTFWLHTDCLNKDFSQSGRRGTKPVNGNKTKDETLNGSQSSSLVSLTEVGTASHVTSDTNAPLVDVICKECANNEPPKCMVCECTESKKPNDPLVKCCMGQCERSFHPACCKYWPQAKITISKNAIESFRCPSHVCHTCVSDDPKGKFQHLNNTKLTKCVKCPSTYHTDSTCIPAGSQILTAAHIICPRHLNPKVDMTVNVNWCFICVGGGQLTCCETCPTAVHAHCLNIPIDANEGYICEECESGRMPLYGEMVWAKFTNFRWWPAIILPPTEIPKNIARKTHNPYEFVVRFFGTHDHGWISRRRVYLYLEGDSSEPPKSKSSLDLSYNKGVEEAKEVYEIIKAKKLQQRSSNENKEKLHPQPYVRIKANRAVPPVKLYVDIESVSKCECDAREENPCGPDSNCLNRVLYHECNPKICPAGERCQNQMFESRVSPRLDVVYMKERGFGLICREFIKAGSFVIEYVGEIINDDEFQARMHQKSRDRDENFYFLSVEKDYIIDAGPKGNLARFMNHSCDPNCETQKWSVNSLNRVGLFAIKDIPANTELTFNYHWDDSLGNEKKTCYCGAKNCAGLIGGKVKDLETLKPPPAVLGNGKNKLKRKPKGRTSSKANKNLLNNREMKNKLASKMKLKAKTKTLHETKKKIAATAKRNNEKSTSANTSKSSLSEETDTNHEPSTSRVLESPDLFS